MSSTQQSHYNHYGQVSFHFGPVREEHVGFCIGSNSSNLKQIYQETGAYIQLMSPDHYHHQNWFLITGTSQQVTHARNWLNSIRKEAINRIEEVVKEQEQQDQYLDKPKTHPTIDLSQLYFKRSFGSLLTIYNVTTNEMIRMLSDGEAGLNEFYNTPSNIQYAYFWSTDPLHLQQALNIRMGVIKTQMGSLKQRRIIEMNQPRFYLNTVLVYFNSDVIDYKRLFQTFLQITGRDLGTVFIRKPEDRYTLGEIIREKPSFFQNINAEEIYTYNWSMNKN